VWPAVVLICCGALPLFGEQADNPWDRVRDIFYVRHFGDEQVYESDDSLSEPPWSNWLPFYENNELYRPAIKALSQFSALSKEKVEDQSPLRRAILLRDLWAAFDRLLDATQRTEPPTAQRKQKLDQQVATPKSKVCQRIADVMRRLELSEAEAAALPDNYQAAISKRAYADKFREDAPDTPFLPTQLFDEAGPWVAISRGPKTIGATGHDQSVSSRSVFVPYLKVADRRDDALAYIEKLKHPTPNYKDRWLPKASVLALARHMMLPTRSGKLVVTPILESLQLISIDAPRDHHFKFVLDRRAILAGEPGLRALTNDDPIDPYSFEVAGLLPMEPQSGSDGEILVMGKYAGPLPKGITSLGHCAACHGATVGDRLFANFGLYDKLATMSASEQISRIIQAKQRSKEWAAYLAERKGAGSAGNR
jgi:hypothetical protein